TVESLIRDEFSPALMVDSSPSLDLSLPPGRKFLTSTSFLLRRHQFHLPEVTGLSPPTHQLLEVEAILRSKRRNRDYFRNVQKQWLRSDHATAAAMVDQVCYSDLSLENLSDFSLCPAGDCLEDVELKRSCDSATMDNQTGDYVGKSCNAHQVFDNLSRTPKQVFCPCHRTEGWRTN
ncbi:hypothetical protein U1Q18_003255, partial [Sarracenia purpurea var. burkii]